MDTTALIQVACASNSKDQLDGHFGSCEQFLIYQVSAEGVSLVDTREVIDKDAEDKTMLRASLIADCDIVYLCEIGGPAAAKVINSGVFPIKQNKHTAAMEVMEQLRARLADKPAPWLAKIMRARSQTCLDA